MVLSPVDHEIVDAEIVGKDEDDVGPLLRPRCRLAVGRRA
jgi:hypothetical protein